MLSIRRYYKHLIKHYFLILQLYIYRIFKTASYIVRCAHIPRCIAMGSHILDQSVRQRFPISPDSESQRQQIATISQTPKSTALTAACCLDDVNLEHVFSILRVGELLENCSSLPLTRQHHATIMSAVLGELELVGSELHEQSSSGGGSTSNCVALLRATVSQIVDFICEAGRDRATYMKEIFCRLIPTSAPRPRSRKC